MEEPKELTPEDVGIGVGASSKKSEGSIDISIVLDRSGSMDSIASDVVGGFNSFIEAQKEVKGKAVVTLVQFDYPTSIETVIDAEDIINVNPLTNSSYIPRGGTALFDAIGKTFVETQKRVVKTKPDQVLFVIITDGEENSSVEWSREKVFEKISAFEKDWQIIFLAANQDAISAGHSVGISMRASSMTVGASAKGAKAMFTTLSDSTKGYRISGEKTTAHYFTESDRKDQVDVDEQK